MREKEKIDWIIQTINNDEALQHDSWVLFDWEDAGLLEVKAGGIKVVNADRLIDAYQDYVSSMEEGDLT